MKKLLFGIIAVLITTVSFAQQGAKSAGIAKNVDPKEFRRLMIEKPGLVLDVRTKGEVDKGAIKGSTNIDFFSDNFESEIDKLDKSKPVYVYCAVGGRSQDTMDMMHQKGFKEVYNLDGGYTAWKKTYPGE